MVTFINFKLICCKCEIAAMNQMSESDHAIKGCSLLAKVAQVMSFFMLRVPYLANGNLLQTLALYIMR